MAYPAQKRYQIVAFFNVCRSLLTLQGFASGSFMPQFPMYGGKRRMDGLPSFKSSRAGQRPANRQPVFRTLSGRVTGIRSSALVTTWISACRAGEI